MKVVHLVTNLNIGGAQLNALYTAEHLKSDQFKPELWSGSYGTLDSKLNVMWFSDLIRSINPLRDVRAFLELRKQLKEAKPDVLHTHSSKAGILGRWAAWCAGVPIVIHTFHGFGFNNQQSAFTRWLFVLLERLTARISTALIFVSKANMRVANNLGIGTPNQYHLIRSGVEVTRVRLEHANCDRDAKRRSLFIRLDAPVVTTIGAFKPQKNLTDFIKIAEIIYQVRPDARFVIIGDGELRPELERQIAAAEMSHAFRLVGWRGDVPELLSITNVFAMTSLWEGLPRALVEALICGVRSVCYATDGINDLKDDLELIQPGDLKGMAQRIMRVIPQLHSDSLAQEFDIDAMVREQESLYRLCLLRTDRFAR